MPVRLLGSLTPDRQDPLAVVLAKFIIELAKQGERDPEKLCNAALKMLEK
jgi:hypothetical protein